MRRPLLFALIAVLLAAGPLGAGEEETKRRIVYVPDDQIGELLERHERGVVLDVTEYLELLRLARAGKLETRVPPGAKAVILAGDMAGRVADGKALLTAVYRVRVLADGMVRVPFPIEGVAVGDVLTDGRPALVAHDRAGGYLLLDGKGDHTVSFDFAVKLRRIEGVGSFAMTFPRATSTSIEVLLPKEHEPLPGTIGGTWRAEETADGVRVRAQLQPGLRFDFAFRRTRGEGSRTTLLSSEGRTLHIVGSRRLRTVSRADVTVWRRGVSELSFTVPVDVFVTGVEAPGLTGWDTRENDGVTTVRLVFKRATTGKVPVFFRLERTLSGPGEITLPEIRLAGAAATHGLVAVRFEAGVEGRILSSEGFVREALPRPPQQKGRNRKAAPPPADRIVLTGAAAAYRYWSADRALTAATKAPEGLLDAEVSVVVGLLEEAREVTAILTLTARGERQFAIETGLPDGYELLDVVTQAPTAATWEKTLGGRLRIEMPSGLAPGAALKLTLRLRHDSDEWRGDGWESVTLPMPIIHPDVNGRLAGYLAVFATAEFDVKDESVAGLVPEPVEMLGLPNAVLGYRWRGGSASGSLVVTRQSPKVSVRHVAIVTPGEKVARYTGFLQYEIARAGIRKFRFLVSGGHGDRLNVLAPDGTEPIRRRREDGTDLWEITLPRNVTGHVLIRLSLEEEMPLVDGVRSFSFPEVTALDVEDETAWLAVESGDNMEVGVPGREEAEAAGLREIGREDMVLLGHRPARGLLSAWQAVGHPWRLALTTRRFRDMPVLAAFVASARLTSVVARDGTVRTRAEYRILNADRQFLRVKLPDGAALWGAFVGGRAVKPSKGPAESMIPLPTTTGDQAIEVVLLYEGRHASLGGSGDLALTAPELVGVVGAEAVWDIVLPGDYRITRAEGVFGAPKRAPADPWLFRAWGEFAGSFSPVMSTERSAVGSAVMDESRHTSMPTGGLEVAADKAKDRGRIRTEALEKAPAPSTPPPPATAAPEPEEAPGMREPQDPMAPGGAVVDGGSPLFEDGEDMDAGKPAPKREGKKVYLPPPRRGRVGVLSIDVPLVPEGSRQRVRALGVAGTVSVSYVDVPARQRRSTVLLWATVIAGLLLTRTIRTRKKAEGLRVHPLLYVVLAGALATFAPAWFDVSDPVMWDAVAQGCLVTLLLFGLARFLRFVTRVGRRANAAVAALLLLVLLAGSARADEPAATPPAEPEKKVETIYVPYDPEKIGELEGADRVFLPFSRFRELWNAAHPDRRIERPEEAPVPWLLTSADYRGEVEDQTAKITATFSLIVLTDEWVEVSIPISGTVVTSATVDGESVPVVAKKGAHVLVIRGRGARRVEMVLRTLVTVRGDQRTVAASLPPVPRSRLVFTLPIDDAKVVLAGPVEPEIDGRTVRALLGPWGILRLTWSPKTDAPTIDARVEVETREAVSLLEGRVDHRQQTVWRVVSGSVSEVAFRLPEGFELLSVTGKDLKTWTVAGGRLTVTLVREVRDSTTVWLHLSRADGTRVRRIALTGPTPIGVVRERGVLGIARSPDLRLLVSDTKNLDRITVNAKDFAGLAGAGAVLDSAYRFLLRPLGVTVETEPVKAEIRVQVPQQFLIEREWLHGRATFNFDVRGDGTFEFPVSLPAKYELERVDGAGIAHWWRDGDRLTFSTASPVRGRFSVGIRYRLRLDPDQAEVTLPEVHALDVTRETSWVLIGHAPGLSLILVADDGLIRENVAGYRKWKKVANTQQNKFAWRHEGEPYRLVVARSFPKARVRPVTTTRLVMEDDRVTVAVQFVFDIENAGQDTFRVFLPEGEGEDFLLAAERKRSITVEEAEHEGRRGRMLTITLQQAAVGRYGFGIAYEKSLTPSARRKGEVRVEALLPLGTNPASYLLVENQSSGQVGWRVPEGAKLSPGDPVRFPYKPSGPFDWRQVLRGFTGKGEWALVLDLTIHDFADFPDALISSAEMVTAVGRDGWTRNRMTYRVLNRTRQFLEITMPDGSRLEAVRVGGRAVKPGRRTVKGEAKDRVVIPLSRMRPGDIATEIEITWSRLLDDAGSGRPLTSLGSKDIREPVIHGLEVERTFFTLSLPDGLDYTFDGNMNRITEAKRKLQGFMEQNREVARLARVVNLGSEAQQVRVLDNFSEVRSNVEELRSWFQDDDNLAGLTNKQREELRQELQDLASNDEIFASGSFLRRATRGDDQNAPETNAAIGKGGKVDEQTIRRAKELYESTRGQTVRFKGKKNILKQGFMDNTIGGQPRSGPATNAEIGRRNRALQEAAVSLGADQNEADNDAPFDGPDTNAAIGIAGGAGGRFAGRAGRRNLRAGGPQEQAQGAGGYFEAYNYRTVRAPVAVAGLLSLPVTVPMTGEIVRFEKLNGGAELTVSASTPGTGREAGALGMFAVVVAVLAVFFRFRPDRRFAGFWPLMLALFVTTALITDLAVGLFVVGGIAAAGWYFGGRWCRRRCADSRRSG